jgi:peptidase E
MVAKALEEVGGDDHVAVVTAGWQEREPEVNALREHIGRHLVNLKLYQRAEEILLEDPALAQGLRERQDRLQRLQTLYRLRLSHALQAARELMQRPEEDVLLAEHRRGAIRALRTLDRQHLVQVRKAHLEFDDTWRPLGRPGVARHRERLAQRLRKTSAVVIAGGHVTVLLNRMRMFDVAELFEARPLIAWSAGAMAICERIVLFHDHPPQGPGDAELLGPGLGRCPNLVPLPHARRRLRLDDPQRVALFARRFSPANCVTLDDGAQAAWDGERWSAGRQTYRLTRRGRLTQLARG